EEMLVLRVPSRSGIGSQKKDAVAVVVILHRKAKVLGIVELLAGAGFGLRVSILERLTQGKRGTGHPRQMLWRSRAQRGMLTEAFQRFPGSVQHPEARKNLERLQAGF